jgi:predicted nucleic acid-binding protein
MIVLDTNAMYGIFKPAPDAYIAATALAMGFAVAPRNKKHFEPMGVAVLNPWEE